MLNPSDPNVLAWLRRTPNGETVVVACNFTAKPQKVRFDLARYGVRATNVEVLMNSPGQAVAKSVGEVALKSYGVTILQVR